MQRSIAGLVLGASLLLPVPAPALTAEDLIGSWHVLAHYKDAGSDHPDRERWLDRVWKFEWEGDKLKWTDYPIVVFDDETGRFERLGTNRQSRVLHYWNPSESQVANIQRGLEVNPRGAKSKTLKQTPEGDWSSAGRARPQSMNFISYVETWGIEDLADRPVFQRADSLSSGITETLEGVTRYSTVAVEEGGAVLTGRYERDGTQEGTFRMMRSAGAEFVKGSGKTQSERLRDSGLLPIVPGTISPEVASAEVQRMIDEGSVDPETRQEIRRAIREGLAEQMRAQGRSPLAQRAELDSLTSQVERLMIDEKKSQAEITELFEKGEIRP